MMKPLILSCFALICLATIAAAEPNIFVVRHAERADDGSHDSATKDPELSEAGRARAESLAKALKDAGITSIYVSELKRTQQTAAPLANAAGLQVTIVPAKDMAALIGKIKAGTGNTLVVGHSNTVPEIVKALGITTPITVGESYDNIFIVVMETPPRLIHLHYR